MAKQKHSFKEKWGSFKNFAKGEPLCAFMGDNYIEKTNSMNRREGRGFVDTAYDFAWWLGTWGKMSGLIMRDPHQDGAGLLALPLALGLPLHAGNGGQVDFGRPRHPPPRRPPCHKRHGV